MSHDFFYDSQIRRFLIQFIRIFSGFQVEYSKDENGNITYLTVPVKYGDPTRMVASFIRENSENKVMSVPQITCYITGLAYEQNRLQDPTFVSKKHIRQRRIDPNTGEYTTAQGNAVTIERLMPVPYRLTLNVDIWTSNTTQKLQLLEQITVFFNPDLEIQSTDNYLDWTSLSHIILTNVNWSSRTVPVGSDDQIDIATLTFELPIWITPPAKVKKLGVVQKLIMSLYDESGSISDGVIDSTLLMGERMKFSPANFGILVLGNTIKILDNNERITNNVENQTSLLNDPPEKIGTDDVTWRALVNQYGELQEGISMIKLDTDVGEVIGTIAFHPADPYSLLFTVQEDTTPTNDLSPVDRIINPLTKAPGSGLAAAADGQRYLLVNDIGSAENTDGADAWKGTGGEELIASANDIIEYDGVKWNVVFDSSADSSVHYLLNTYSGQQYRWTGTTWVRAWEGEYKAGDWCLVI